MRWKIWRSSAILYSLRRVGPPLSPELPRVQTPIRIGTRGSPLALAQTRLVIAALARAHGWTPDEAAARTQVVTVKTSGDRIQDRPLADLGGKGLFAKELEVHSMKDVPMTLPEGFVLPAILEREDPRDAFVSNHYRSLAELPAGSVVGTSSLRRESQLRARYPALDVRPLRGNVQTRLRKLDEGQYAAIILAAAGLRRLGLAARIASLLSPEESLPAVGQGAVGIECRGDHAALVDTLAALGDPVTTACVKAERAMSRALAGSCTVPLGGFAEVTGDSMRVRGFVASPDGRRMVSDEVSGAPAECEALGRALAQRLTALGAAEILAALA